LLINICLDGTFRNCMWGFCWLCSYRYIQKLYVGLFVDYV
jgi:hypothetical protein